MLLAPKNHFTNFLGNTFLVILNNEFELLKNDSNVAESKILSVYKHYNFFR